MKVVPTKKGKDRLDENGTQLKPKGKHLLFIAQT